MKAVNLPGSLYFSMMSMVLVQAETIHFGSMNTFGSFRFDWADTASMVAWCAVLPPSCIISDQRFAVGSAIISGLPARSSLIVPMPSLWSVTATQSSGSASLAFWPVLVVVSSPRTKRTASSGESVVPESPASADQPVCTCSSPQNTRSGNLVGIGTLLIAVAGSATGGRAVTASGDLEQPGSANEATPA